LAEASDEQPIAPRQYMAFQMHFAFAPAIKMMVNVLVIW
jgi:hypothetical protein